MTIRCKNCGRTATKKNHVYICGGCDACSTLQLQIEIDGVKYLKAERSWDIWMKLKNGDLERYTGTTREFDAMVEEHIRNEVRRERACIGN